MTDQPQTPEPDSGAPVQPTVVSPVQPTTPPVAEPAPATPLQPTTPPVAESAPATPVEPAAAPAPASYTKPSAPAPGEWPAPPQLDDESSDGTGRSAAAERPELAVGGAFAGGFLLAMILKRLAR